MKSYITEANPKRNNYAVLQQKQGSASFMQPGKKVMLKESLHQKAATINEEEEESYIVIRTGERYSHRGYKGL